MSFLSGYVLSIVGIVFMFLVIELILPEGKNAKYIRSILGIFLIFVIIAPVSRIKNLDLSTIFSENQIHYTLDYDYLYGIHLKQKYQLEEDLTKFIEKNNITGVCVVVNIEKSSSNFEVTQIFVDLSRAVISQNNEHIINYTTLKTMIAQYANVDQNKVVVND